MKAPTQGDLAKAIQVLRYLRGTPNHGPTYYTSKGAVVVAHVDAA